MATCRTEKTKRAAAPAATMARRLAPEEIRPGDYVAVLRETNEWPSFFWNCAGVPLPPDKLVRIARMPEQPGTPFKVRSICLPFVLVKQPSGESKTLDVRNCELARLDEAFARQAWKAQGTTKPTE